MRCQATGRCTAPGDHGLPQPEQGTAGPSAAEPAPMRAGAEGAEVPAAAHGIQRESAPTR